MVYGTHLCLDNSVDDKSCRNLVTRITYPAYCTRTRPVGQDCAQYVKESRVGRTASPDVSVQVWDSARAYIPLNSMNPGARTWKVGLEFEVGGTSAILHSQEFTLYNPDKKPAGCEMVGDYEPLTLKCKCLFRNKDSAT